MALENDINVTAVTDEAGFAALREQWNALADVAETGTVFLRHEWFDAAWQWLAGDCERLILLVTRADRLVGIWPLVIRQKTQRKIGVRSVEFMPERRSQRKVCATATAGRVGSGQSSAVTGRPVRSAAPAPGPLLQLPG